MFSTSALCVCNCTLSEVLNVVRMNKLSLLYGTLNVYGSVLIVEVHVTCRKHVLCICEFKGSSLKESLGTPGW